MLLKDRLFFKIAIFNAIKCKLQCDDRFDQRRTVLRCKCRKGGCDWNDVQLFCRREEEIEITTRAPAAGGICEPLYSELGNWGCSKGFHFNSR